VLFHTTWPYFYFLLCFGADLLTAAHIAALWAFVTKNCSDIKKAVLLTKSVKLGWGPAQFPVRPKWK
jgi:hypothetical protein